MPSANRRLENKMMQVESIQRSQIKLWSANPRRNDRAAIELAGLLRQNGIRSPINLWKNNMTVYKGNTSLKAMDLISKEGAKAGDHWGIKFIYAEKDFKVPCLLHEFSSENEAVAYGLADNKASEFADWDDEVLSQILTSKGIQPLLKSTGFKDKEISNILWKPTGVDEIEETDSGMSARVMVFQVPPSDKEEIVKILREWAENSGFDGVVIK